MNVEKYDLIVIGGGPAGEKGAAQAAYFGKKVALIEKKPNPGRRGRGDQHTVQGASRDRAVSGGLSHPQAAGHRLPPQGTADAA